MSSRWPDRPRPDSNSSSTPPARASSWARRTAARIGSLPGSGATRSRSSRRDCEPGSANWTGDSTSWTPGSSARSDTWPTAAFTIVAPIGGVVWSSTVGPRQRSLSRVDGHGDRRSGSIGHRGRLQGRGCRADSSGRAGQGSPARFVPDPRRSGRPRVRSRRDRPGDGSAGPLGTRRLPGLFGRSSSWMNSPRAAMRRTDDYIGGSAVVWMAR